MTPSSRAARGADTMHPDALQACVAFLGIDEDDVIELRDGADLLPALLAGIGLELRRKHAATDDDQAQVFCRSVLAGWGETPFTAAGLIAWCAAGITPPQRAALAACRAICRLPAGGDLSPFGLGKALRRVALETESEPLRLEAAGDARGALRWRVRGSRG